MDAGRARRRPSFRCRSDDCPARIASLLDERKKLERELADARKKLAMGGGGAASADDGVRSIGGVKLLARAVVGRRRQGLKSLADEGKKQIGSGVCRSSSA